MAAPVPAPVFWVRRARTVPGNNAFVVPEGEAVEVSSQVLLNGALVTLPFRHVGHLIKVARETEFLPELKDVGTSSLRLCRAAPATATDDDGDAEMTDAAAAAPPTGAVRVAELRPGMLLSDLHKDVTTTDTAPLYLCAPAAPALPPHLQPVQLQQPMQLKLAAYTALFDHLRQGQSILVKTAEGIQYLELPAGNISAIRRLLIRSDYQELADLLLFKLHRTPVAEDDNERRTWVVRGSAGVGKSTFLLYFMWRWFQVPDSERRHDLVAFGPPGSDGETFVFVPAKLVDGPVKLDGPGSTTERYLMVFDACDPKEGPSQHDYLVATSPREAIIRSVGKHPGCRKRFLPMFSEADMQALVALRGRTWDAHMRRRFGIVGGNPRALFAEEEGDDWMREKLSAAPIQYLNKMVESVHFGHAEVRAVQRVPGGAGWPVGRAGSGL